MHAYFFLARRPQRGTLVALDDRTRLPWRFLARHMAIDALTRSA